MTKFLFLRHGQSTANGFNRFCGQLDSPLTELGFAQAKEAGEFIAKNYKIDAIFSSDLIRVVNTVEPVAKLCNLEINLTKELREINVGSWQGYLVEEISKLDKQNYEKYRHGDTSVKLGGAESFEDVYVRAKNVIDKIASEYDGKTVLIASHGGVIRMLCKAWLNVSDYVMRTKYGISNASLTEVDYDGKTANVIFINKCDYLLKSTGDEQTNAIFEEKPD